MFKSATGAIAAALLSLVVAGCGGSGNIGSTGGTAGGTTGGTPGGGTPITCPTGQVPNSDGTACVAAPPTGSGVPQTLQVSSAQQSIIADGSSAAVVTATILDTTGQPISGRAISFSVNAGSVSSPSVNSDASGMTTISVISSVVAGRATLVARDVGSGLSASTTINYVAGPAAAITLSAAPATVSPTAQSTVAVAVADANGNAVLGEPVSLSFTQNASGAALSSLSLTTDANGQASSGYTSGSNTGVDTIRGQLASGLSQSASITVAAVVRTTGGVTLALGNASPAVGSSSSVTAVVADDNNNPLQGVAVSFQTTAGSIPATAQTDSQGRATVNFVAPQTTGPVTITASSSGIVARQTATVVSGSPSSLIVSLAPATVAPGRTASVSARLTDGRNAISGRTIQFAAPAAAGSFSAASASTDASGVATVSFTAANATTASTVPVSATLNPEGLSATQNLNVDPAAVTVQNITLTALSNSAPANGTSTVTLRADATGTDGQPVSAASVNFSSSLGSPGTATVSTDASGRATYVLTAPNRSGNATVTASSGGVTRQTVVSFVAGPASVVTLNLNPNSVGSASSASATVSVTDANNNPVQGETVQFSAPMATNCTGGSFTSGTALQTGVDGTVTATYTTGTASAGCTSDRLRATLSSNTATFTESNLAILSNVGALALTAAQPSLIANGNDSTTLTARVTDANGNPVRNATVQFRTSKGSLTPASGMVTTDSTGVATAQVRADTRAGSVAVSAVLSGAGGALLTASAALQFVADVPATVTAMASPAAVAPGATTSITVVVLDANRNAVPNQNLTVSQPTNASGGTPSAFALTTDASGRATLSYTAGSSSGADDLSFTTDNNVLGSVTVNSSANNALVGNVTLLLGANTVQASSSGSTVAVRATVTASGSGAPISGASVSFTASGGTLSAVSALTNGNGVATVQLTPPTKASSVSLRASASGFITEQVLTVTPGPAAAAQSSITVNPGTILADGNSTATVTVSLNDEFANPLADGTAVSVTSTAGTFVGGSSGGLASGQAAFTLRSSTTPSNSVVVTSPGVAGLQSNTVTFAAATTGDPASLRLAAATNSIFVSGVGQNDSSAITVNVLDSSGAAINEAGYVNGPINNLRVRFLARPNGGEVLSGRNFGNSVVSSSTNAADPAYQFIDVATNNGIAVLNLQSGVISGIVELQFSVLRYTGTDFAVPADVAASASLPQISIASGPAASIVFTQPVTSAISNLQNGNYQLRGSIDVRDQYGNNVPDGTVLNLTAIDSVIVHDNTGVTAAGAATLTRSGNSLTTTRCNEPLTGFEATNCAAAASNFSTTITRNGTARGVRTNDSLILRNAVSQDKKRTVNTVDSTTQLTAQSAFTASLPATTPTNPNNGEFWLGTQALGISVSGFSVSGGLTTGVATTTDGIAPILVDYPANQNTILSGCFGYNAPDGRYSNADRRDSVPQSRQVVLAATAGNNVTGVNIGDFCFKVFAGAQVTPDIATAQLNPNGGSIVVPIRVVDGGPAIGGDSIPLSFVPLRCNVVFTRVAGSTFSVMAVVNPNAGGFQATGFDASTGGAGFGSVTVTRTDDGTGVDPNDSAAVTCIALDGAGTITITP